MFGQKFLLWSPEIGPNNWNSAERKLLSFHGKTSFFFGWNIDETFQNVEHWSADQKLKNARGNPKYMLKR